MRACEWVGGRACVHARVGWMGTRFHADSCPQNVRGRVNSLASSEALITDFLSKRKTTHGTPNHTSPIACARTDARATGRTIETRNSVHLPPHSPSKQVWLKLFNSLSTAVRIETISCACLADMAGPEVTADERAPACLASRENCKTEHHHQTEGKKTGGLSAVITRNLPTTLAASNTAKHE